jgi:hypothetical protein
MVFNVTLSNISMSSSISIPLYVIHDSLAHKDNNNYIWSMYLLVDPILKSLWFLSWFIWKEVAAEKETTEPMVPSG